MPYSKTASTFNLFAPQISLSFYAQARHEMWVAHQRGDEPPAGLPAPMYEWTLTNNWRELDRTTAYVINEVLPRFPTGSPEQILEVAAFRSLGKIETDKAIVERFGCWNAAVEAGWTRMYQALPVRPLTGAYARLVGIQKALHAGPIIQRESRHIDAARHLAVQNYPYARFSLSDGTYLGMFVAAQVLFDVTWRGGPLPVYVGDLRFGVGAAHGLSLALGYDLLMTRRGNPEVDVGMMQTVADEEWDACYQWASVRGAPRINGERALIALRELEQILCEYSRVCRLMEYGRVSSLRRYKPNPEPFALPPGWSV